MENEGAGAKNNHRCFHGSNAFDDPNMGCLRAPTGVVDLHTLFQGREKIPFPTLFQPYRDLV